MAQVIMTMEEFKQADNLKNKAHSLKESVKGMTIFDDPTSCGNTEQDIVRAFSLEETKELVKMILSIEV